LFYQEAKVLLIDQFWNLTKDLLNLLMLYRFKQILSKGDMQPVALFPYSPMKNITNWSFLGCKMLKQCLLPRSCRCWRCFRHMV